MLANRRAVRPDGQHYRNSRRQRVARAFRQGGSQSSVPAALLLLSVAGGLIYLGIRLGGWSLAFCIAGAIAALLLLGVVIIFKS